MKPQKALGIVGWFLKGGYNFGNTFSNWAADRLEMSYKGKKIGGGLFDTAAGIGITLYSSNMIVGTALTAVAAAGAIATAPVHAAITLPVAAVFLLLGTSMLGMGVGFLNAAREKAGIPIPQILTRGVNKTRDFIADGAGLAGKPFKALGNGADAVKNVFQSGAEKLSSKFKTAVLRQKPENKPKKPKLTPKNNSFKFQP